MASTSGLDEEAAQAELRLQANIELSLKLQEACRDGDVGRAKQLLEQGAAAWYQDETGWTALHFAAEYGDVELVEHLLRNGAAWNLVDNLGFTAGDVAYSLNGKACFDAIVAEGVREQMLRAILDASAGDDDDQDDAMADEATSSEVVPKSTASDNKAFLASKLRYEGSEGDERCLDSEGNGVMMGWELPIMVETARLLGAGREQDSLSVLNVGFGLGLIDTELQKHEPGRHVIVEPHPDVLAFARSKGWYEKPGVEIFEGTWQEFIKAYEAGEVEGEFDAIYFDTFSEHYKDLHAFFDVLPNLLRDPDARFSFFHGLGATSMTFYDCYTSVSEMHLREVGLTTEWHTVSMLDHGEVTWEGVNRRVSSRRGASTPEFS